ncbi:MAG: hypothetical protein ACOY3L_03920 [Pseudomonadota bacterium]
MQFIFFAAAAVATYFAADRLVDWIERRRKERFVDRTILFFAIYLGLLLVVFFAIRRIGGE